ncbi:MAG: type II secretion system minor pseudopilin GspK [Quisquiliibacterium sp.]
MSARLYSHFRRNQEGAAIVAALLIVTLATTVVAGLFVRENVTLRSAENRQALAQSRWIERAAIDWARVILRADARAGVVDHLGEPWAVPVAQTELDETVSPGTQIGRTSRPATLAGQMIDAQSRLNLNSLIASGQVVEKQLEALRRLFEFLGIGASKADTVLERVRRAQPRVQEGKTLPALQPPLLRLTDLMALPGFDAQSVERLREFAVVLPRPSSVNVNTAPAEVMAAMVPELDLIGARRFVAQRERTYFRNLGQASALIDGQPVLSPALMGVASNYFLVRGMVRFERVESLSETLLERSTDRVEIVWQQRY